MTVQNPIRGRAVTFASSKGGVGKTTTTACIAVRAAIDHPKVAMVDIDSSHGLEDWAKRRAGGNASQANPRLFTIKDVSNVVEGAALLKQQGWGWVFIDSPPAPAEGFEQAIKAADFVVIPIKASPLDAIAITATVNACELHGKPFAFLMTMHMPTWKVSKQVRKALTQYGTVIKPVLSNSMAYVSAMTSGKTGPEYTVTDKRGLKAAEKLAAEAKDEVDAVWESILATMSATVK